MALRHAALPVILAALLVATACGGNGPNGAGEQVIEGRVHDVVPASLTEVASLSIIDFSGNVWEFEGAGFAGLTPAHLREHQSMGDIVEVRYRTEGGRNILIEVSHD